MSTTEPRHHVNTDALRQLLALARDLLKAADLNSAMDLAGAAMSELLLADSALLLVVLNGREHRAEFDRRGRRLLGEHYTTLYQNARNAIGANTALVLPPLDAETPLAAAFAAPSACIAAAPFPPLNALGAAAIAWDRRPHRYQLARRVSLLRHIAALTAAALSNIEAKQALLGVAWARSAALSAATQQHAREIRQRDQLAEENHRMSITDVLTGMANRRGFFMQAEQSFKVAQRQGAPSALIFADIDGLKDINDEWGHDIGDHLIQDSAYLLRKSFRASDIVARLGGDEFAAFTLDDIHPELILNRIQDNMHDFNQRVSRPYQVSFSIGIVQCDPGSGLSLHRYLALADEQMYSKKKTRPPGRLASAILQL
jgi:diguanylate cyclase (GGDEF)-like protein